MFVNPAGQRDNLGDSVLRRPYLAALRNAGELHVLVGAHVDYASGLGLSATDIRYESKSRWLMSAFRAALTGRMTFAANAGEYEGSLREWRRGVWQVMLALLARSSGGIVIISGASLRAGTSIHRTHLRALSRLGQIATWRDEKTAKLAGKGAVQPDWAFSTGTRSSSVARGSIAVLMRGDRPAPSDSWCEAVMAFARDHSLRIVVATQVRRDATRAVDLAERLGADRFDWLAARNHAEHEKAMRSLYQGCAFVVSDRIHALIIGATEGAVPVAFSTTDMRKIDRTLSVVFGSAFPRLNHNGTTVEFDLKGFTAASVGQSLANARVSLANAAEAIADAAQARD